MVTSGCGPVLEDAVGAVDADVVGRPVVNARIFNVLSSNRYVHEGVICKAVAAQGSLLCDLWDAIGERLEGGDGPWKRNNPDDVASHGLKPS